MVVSSAEYDKMMKVGGIAYDGFFSEAHLPVKHIGSGLSTLVSSGKLEEVSSEGREFVFLHGNTGTYWKYSLEIIDGGVREVVELRHNAPSAEDAILAGHECMGDVTGLLVGAKGI